MARGGGRPPKLREQRVLEGGTMGNGAVSKRKMPTAIVLAPRVTPEGKPEYPADLPEESRELWDDAIQYLVDRNIAQVLDIPTLKVLCLLYAGAMQAAQVIGEQGRYTKGSMGQMRQHPAVKDFNEQSVLFLRYASEYGLTALARTRLGLLDVTRRSLESDLTASLGRNPRRTNRPAPAA